MFDLYQEKKNSIKDICSMFDITKPTLYKVIEEFSNNSNVENIYKKQLFYGI
ncbi:helix-turn-helix domain-containing protein [Clostridium pasteurianum]|uniref:helix-turn-helix domain-containing protein n=1 Tax=Clostridium pasteurianum TaxID=1501 RepID=UPI0024187987|nr:helix-turn-helix domain-containing protein [Clostridium pasteurianum]